MACCKAKLFFVIETSSYRSISAQPLHLLHEVLSVNSSPGITQQPNKVINMFLVFVYLHCLMFKKLNSNGGLYNQPQHEALRCLMFKKLNSNGGLYNQPQHEALRRKT
jgi:hypothetical protein